MEKDPLALNTQAINNDSSNSESVNSDESTCDEGSNSSAVLEISKPKRNSKVLKHWMYVRQYDNLRSVMEFLEKEKIWSHEYKNHTKTGLKVFYRCNLVKSRGDQCAAHIYFFFGNGTEVVLQYKTDSEHTHEELNLKRLMSSKPGSSRRQLIPENVQAEIKRLYEEGVKPKSIPYFLEKYNFEVPDIKDFKYFLIKLRKDGVKPYEKLISPSISVSSQQRVTETSGETSKSQDNFLTRYIKRTMKDTEVCNQSKAKMIKTELIQVSDDDEENTSETDSTRPESIATEETSLPENFLSAIIPYKTENKQTMQREINNSKLLNEPNICDDNDENITVKEQSLPQNITLKESKPIQTLNSPLDEKVSNNPLKLADSQESHDENTKADSTSNRKISSRNKNFILQKTFSNPKEAEEYVENLKIWSSTFKHNSKVGLRVTYRCNLVRSRGEQCAAGLQLLHVANSSTIRLYLSDNEHTHMDIDTRKGCLLSEAFENEIREMVEIGYKPRQINYLLTKKGFDVEGAGTQVKNLYLRLRKEKMENLAMTGQTVAKPSSDNSSLMAATAAEMILDDTYVKLEDQVGLPAVQTFHDSVVASEDLQIIPDGYIITEIKEEDPFIIDG